MKVLLTGSNGQLGRCFIDIFPSNWSLIKANHQQLDITDGFAVDVFVTKYKPDVIVNAAAYTAVDKAEDEYELANKVNALGPANLAKVAKKNNTKFIHISTDYVFNGSKNFPYIETDTTDPINVYGTTKRAGEIAVLDIYPSTIVIRTSWVFSEYGNNFVKTMLKLSSTESELSIINDQFGCPTYAGDIAKTILKMLINVNQGGVYHFCGDQYVSWFQFANKIFSIINKLNLENNKKIIIKPILTTDYQTKAKRPLFSVLNMNKIEQFGIKGSNWKKALEHVISHIYLK